MQGSVFQWIASFFDGDQLDGWEFDEECKQAVVAQSLGGKKDPPRALPKDSVRSRRAYVPKCI